MKSRNRRNWRGLSQVDLVQNCAFVRISSELNQKRLFEQHWLNTLMRTPSLRFMLSASSSHSAVRHCVEARIQPKLGVFNFNYSQ